MTLWRVCLLAPGKVNSWSLAMLIKQVLAIKVSGSWPRLTMKSTRLSKES